MNNSNHQTNEHPQAEVAQDDNDMNILVIQYQILSNREISHDNMMWDTPTLLFAAQTLLWSIALDDSVFELFRVVISLSAILISFVSFQIFLRHRTMEIADAEQLYSIEKFFEENVPFPSLIIHHRLGKRTLFSKNRRLFVVDKLRQSRALSSNPLSKLSSFFVWELAFWAFLGISFMVFYTISIF